MEYRDDLGAAHHRIAALEGRIEELEGDPLRTRLEARIADLAAEVMRLRGLARGRAVAGAAVPGGLALIAYVAVIRDFDHAGWIAAQLAVVAGFVGSAWAWGCARAFWPFAALTGVRATFFLWWAHGWWEPFYGDLDRFARSQLGRNDPGYYFFWWAPLLATLMVVGEGLLARAWVAVTARRV